MKRLDPITCIVFKYSQLPRCQRAGLVELERLRNKCVPEFGSVLALLIWLKSAL